MSTTPGDFGTQPSRLEAAHRALEESRLIIEQVEVRHGQLLKEQAEYLATQEKAVREAEPRNTDIDKRIADLISAIDALRQRRL